MQKRAELRREIAELDKQYRLTANVLGIGVSGLFALRALFEQNAQRASDLAQILGYEATSFTPILDRLERRGLVERQANTEDRRSVLIVLTDKALGFQTLITKTIDLS